MPGVLSRSIAPHPGQDQTVVNILIKLREEQERVKTTLKKKKAVMTDDEIEKIKSIKEDIDKPCKCARGNCLAALKESTLDYTKAVCTILNTRETTLQKGHNNKGQQKDSLRSAFESSITGIDGSGRTKHNFSVGDAEGLCREAFARAHGVTKNLIDSLASERKRGLQSSADRTINRRSHLVAAEKDLERAFKNNKLEILPENRERALSKDDPSHIECVGWFKDYFYFSGDHMPNGGGIQIEYQLLSDMYNLYLKEAVYKPVCYKEWKRTWREIFPHVKMRIYKQVSGKCHTCATLADLRTKFRHRYLKQMATDLHSFHRDVYMGERQAYYARRKEAIENPDEVFSCIVDGMAQTHSHIPHFGNLSQSQTHLKLKLQAVLDHGRDFFYMFLSTHSCPSSTNLALHTFYLSLERWVREKERYPKTIYWQIDGGPENANAYVYAFAEYLVAQTPIQEIYVTRLPVGHTHEDIDARFGTIWDHCRLRHIHTPYDYQKMLMEAFPQKNRSVEFVSCVPDYCSFLHDNIDPWFAHFAKEDSTKLQFHFKKTSDPRYPSGVAMTYRAFCQDQVIIILKKDDIAVENRSDSCNEIEHQAMRANIRQEPWNEHTKRVCPTFILDRLPSKSIVPSELMPDSRKILEAVVSLAVSKWGAKSSQAMGYSKFDSEYAPKTNSVLGYLKDHPQIYPRSFGPLFVNLGKPIEDEHRDSVTRVQRKRVRDEELLEISSTDSVTRRDNREWKSPYIFCNTGAPVMKRKTRSKKLKKSTTDETSTDLLRPRTYKFMSNKDLVNLIKSINTEFNLNIKYAGNKDVLIRRVEEAVAQAKQKNVISTPVVIETDSSSDEKEDAEDCDDE